MSPRSHGLSPRVPFVPEPLSRSFDRRVLRIAPLVPPAYDPLDGQGANDDGLPLGPASASRRSPLQIWGQLPRSSWRSRCRLAVALYRWGEFGCDPGRKKLLAPLNFFKSKPATAVLCCRSSTACVRQRERAQPEFERGSGQYPCQRRVWNVIYRMYRAYLLVVFRGPWQCTSSRLLVAGCWMRHVCEHAVAGPSEIVLRAWVRVVEQQVCRNS